MAYRPRRGTISRSRRTAAKRAEQQRVKMALQQLEDAKKAETRSRSKWGNIGKFIGLAAAFVTGGAALANPALLSLFLAGGKTLGDVAYTEEHSGSGGFIPGSSAQESDIAKAGETLGDVAGTTLFSETQEAADLGVELAEAAEEEITDTDIGTSLGTFLTEYAQSYIQTASMAKLGSFAGSSVIDPATGVASTATDPVSLLDWAGRGSWREEAKVIKHLVRNAPRNV